MKAKNKLRQLDFLLGKWHTVGKVKAGSGQRAATMEGTDSYAWVADGAFMLHTVHMQVGGKRVEAVELIGHDAALNIYPMQAFDNEGNVVNMTACIVRKGVLRVFGNGMRAELKADLKKGRMKAMWERSDDNGWSWKPWMEMSFRLQRSY